MSVIVDGGWIRLMLRYFMVLIVDILLLLKLMFVKFLRGMDLIIVS